MTLVLKIGRVLVIWTQRTLIRNILLFETYFGRKPGTQVLFVLSFYYACVKLPSDRGIR